MHNRTLVVLMTLCAALLLLCISCGGGETPTVTASPTASPTPTEEPQIIGWSWTGIYSKPNGETYQITGTTRSRVAPDCPPYRVIPDVQIDMLVTCNRQAILATSTPTPTPDR